MECIVRPLVPDVQERQNAERDANREACHVDQGVDLVPQEIAIRNDQVISEPGSRAFEGVTRTSNGFVDSLSRTL